MKNLINITPNQILEKGQYLLIKVDENSNSTPFIGNGIEISNHILSICEDQILSNWGEEEIENDLIEVDLEDGDKNCLRQFKEGDNFELMWNEYSEIIYAEDLGDLLNEDYFVSVYEIIS